MSRLAAVALTVGLLLGSGAVTAVVGAGPPQNTAVQTPDGFDQTTFQVTLYENGSATWAIIHRTPLANDTEQRQFEAFAEEFETTETPLYRNFVDQSRALTRFGTNVTGRNMTASGYDRSASVDPLQNTGTVTMSFRWQRFAILDGDSVVVSDVFEGGFYIGPSQSFVFQRGPGLAFAGAQPDPDSRSAPDSLADSESVTWTGERSFNDRRPYVELAPREAGQADGPSTTQPSETAAGADSGTGWLLPAAVALVAIIVGGAVAWRSGALATLVGADGDDPPAATASSGASPAQSSAEAPDAAEPAANSAAGDPAEEPAVPDEELLTDSDRVRKLLEDNGGRMKQVDIVDSTDWSKSKVSMLLSDMEDEGDISKLRVGRENIISLAGQEPDAAGSPFDEE